jgi:hypothetical protein
MSVSCLPRPSCPSIAHDPSLSPNAKAVYYAAFEWIEVEGVCACTYAHIQSSTGLEAKTLQRAVRELEERGFVVRSRVGTTVHVKLDTGLVDTRDRTSPVCVVGEKENLPSGHSLNNPNTSDCPVTRDLIDIGVKPSVARKLVQQHPEELVRAWIAESALRASSNQAGWVVAALKRGWELPAYYSKPFTPLQIAEAAFRGAAPEIQKDLVRQAHHSEDGAAKIAREIARGLPHLREGLDAAAAVNYLASTIEARTAKKPVEVAHEHLEHHEPLEVVQHAHEDLQALPREGLGELWASLTSEVPRG